MRVAVLVHNDVVKDARVRKEVRTLVQAGHEVDVYGLTESLTEKSYPSSIEGSNNLQLVERRGARLATSFRRLHRFTRQHGRHVSTLVARTSAPATSVTAPATRTATMTLERRIISRVMAPYRKFSGWLQFQAFGMFFRDLASLLETRVAKGSYDVIHCHDVIALLAGAAIKKKRPGVKLFWDAHEIYEDLAQGNVHLGSLMRDLIRHNQELVDGFITISESFAEFYGENYRLPKARVVMNATRYEGPASDDGTLRAAAGLGPDRKILLFQGGLAHKRGIEKLAEAAKNLPEPWSIVAMGWGELEGHLTQVARDLGSGKSPENAPLVVIPPAPQEDLARWTAGAKIGIIPYENTGRNHLYCTPNKLWEFPNAGVPILATDLVEMARMITTWKTGFLLPREFTAQDILDFLASVEDGEIESRRKNCARFSREMSWSRFEPELLGLYDETVRA